MSIMILALGAFFAFMITGILLLAVVLFLIRDPKPFAKDPASETPEAPETLETPKTDGTPTPPRSHEIPLPSDEDPR